ncbi:hypothetical protein Tco_0476391 [Tanacetum coccineum]
MSTQQDIYAAHSENRPPMLKKENYVPWSSRLLRYAKIRPNGKLIYSSIINGPYVRRMNPEPCDAVRAVPVPETFHEQTDDELTEAEINRWKLMIKQFRPFFSVFMKTSMLLLIVERFTSTDGESIESYYHRFSKLMNDFKRNKHFPEKIANLPSSSTFIQQPLPNNNYNPQPSFNQNYMQQPMLNPEDITDPTTAINMELVLMVKTFKLNYSTPTNNNQRISSNPQNRQIAQPGMNWGQDNQIQMNGLIVILGIANQNRNGNVVASRAEGNAIRNNGNQIRCYNYIGLGHLARNYTVRPRRRDAAYLQTQLLIA